MLQAANNGLFSALVPKAHNGECKNLPFPLQVKSVNSVKADFNFFCKLGTKRQPHVFGGKIYTAIF